jgi:hypothetical protein
MVVSGELSTASGDLDSAFCIQAKFDEFPQEELLATSSST